MMSRSIGENLKKKVILFFSNYLPLKIWTLKCSLTSFVIPIIVFSLVDKRAGFSNPKVVGSNPGSVTFFFFFTFFCSFFF